MAQPTSVEERANHLEQRMANLEERMDALNNKIDVSTESIRGDIKTVLERVDGLGEEMRRGFEAIRKEHRADHRLVVAILKDHGTRLQSLEQTLKPPLDSTTPDK